MGYKQQVFSVWVVFISFDIRVESFISPSIHSTKQLSTGSLSLSASKNKDNKSEGKKLTPVQKAIQNGSGKDLSEFDKLKQAAYNAADGIQKFGKWEDKLDVKSVVIDGYADLKSSKGTRSERILKASETTTPIESRPSLNILESLKGAVYGTVDATASTGKSVAPSGKQETPTKENVPAKRIISQDKLLALPDLKSDNPLKRFAAEIKLNIMEVEESLKKKQNEISEGIDNVKDSIYSAGDRINETVDYVKAVPGRVNVFIEETTEVIESIPGAVQNTIDEVTSIPTKVEAKVKEVKDSVDSTVDKTKQVIEDVKAIPSKVQDTVESAKKTINMTVQSVEEAKTNTKVLLGLEKPKPKPPKTPPPKPPTGNDLALKVVGTVASFTGKALLWTGKTAADLTVKAATKGVEAMKESAVNQKMDTLLVDSTASKPNSYRSTDASSEKVTIGDSQSSMSIAPPPREEAAAKTLAKKELQDTIDLENEVAEALQLAEAALQEPVNSINNDSKQSKTSKGPKSSKKGKK